MTFLEERVFEKNMYDKFGAFLYYVYFLELYFLKLVNAFIHYSFEEEGFFEKNVIYFATSIFLKIYVG